MPRLLICLALLGVVACAPAPHAHAQNLKQLTVTELGKPIQTARRMTEAVAAPTPEHPAGVFIGQFFNYGYGDPRYANLPEWLVLDLATGEQQRFDLPGYANGNYRIDNQCRAANGRIFFGAAGAQVHYYEPKTNRMETLGSVLPADKGYSFLYRLEFGNDGMLYGGAQSSNGYGGVVQINPDTLAVRAWTEINTQREEKLTYVYYLALDAPWIYAMVGKGKWQLIAINTETNEKRLLKDGAEWMSASYRADGVRFSMKIPVTPDIQLPAAGEKARVEGNRLLSPTAINEYWIAVDGALYPQNLEKNEQNLPARTQELKPYVPAKDDLAQVVEIGDCDSQGQVVVQWRPAGAAEDVLRVTTGKVTRTRPIHLESLVLLPDGSLLGNAQQYCGFFRYYPAAERMEVFPSHGPSGPVHLVQDGINYFVGYPNTIMYSYDPTRPWNPAPKGATVPAEPQYNPRALGHFGTDAKTHFAYYLRPSASGRMYFAGRCERGVTGGGVGWYDRTDNSFHGHHRDLNFLTPRGLLVCDSLSRVVYSGQLNDDPNATTPKPSEAQLVVFDLDLNEVERLTVKPGLTHTGKLYPGVKPDEIIGHIDNDKTKQYALYRYNLAQRKLLQWVDLPAPLGGIFERPSDHTWWCQDDNKVLYRFDPATLKVTPVAQLDRGIASPIWVGDVLYGRNEAALVRVKP